MKDSVVDIFRNYLLLAVTLLSIAALPANAAAQPDAAKLKWIGSTPSVNTPNSFGVPFDKGTVTKKSEFTLTDASGNNLMYDFYPLAYWQDGSVKWGGFAAVIPGGSEYVTLSPKIQQKRNNKKSPMPISCVKETPEQFIVATGNITAYIPREGSNLIDSIISGSKKTAGAVKLIAATRHDIAKSDNTTSTEQQEFVSRLDNVTVERAGAVRTVVKLTGKHASANRKWLPFTVRLYFYRGSGQIRMVHTFVYDGDQNTDMISALGIKIDVPLSERNYNRHVAFSTADGGVWSEPVQPLVGRRVAKLNDNPIDVQRTQMTGQRLPNPEEFNEVGRQLIDELAQWDGYRLSQLNADSYSIRKRATNHSPWIGTFSGSRAAGVGYVGDCSGGIAVGISDFWQSYPSTLEINGARSQEAELTAWIWSPEAEPMDLRHYDDIAHGLLSSYEDVQEGMSTPYGIARTSELTITPYIYKGKALFAEETAAMGSDAQIMCEPSYLHDRRAFGIWSLPSRSTTFRASIESRLDEIIDYYSHAREEHKWYGFWNYGDFMHAYDPVRHEWRYDVGGYAWDNTELASNMWLWYSFLRSGRADIWQMAKAMSRHTGEVDVYHIGDNAGLGSRHNVSHWGCGAKEARISQAAWNRFLYYLTCDERSGDLMTEVKDAEQKLYTLDPMRLAQPRSKYPCTAPARLRVGPDWIAYAGNWMTQWERTGDTAYRDKIVAGMKSIAALPNKIFTGPAVLGFDPATGVLSYEGAPEIMNTNHLLSIMGGFEIINELNEMLPIKEWIDCWNDYTANFHRVSREVTNKKFPIPRLAAHGAAWSGSEELKNEAWEYMLRGTKEMRPYTVNTIRRPEVASDRMEIPEMSTNGAATWSLDAIYMLEVIPDYEPKNENSLTANNSGNNFKKLWSVESESPDYQVTIMGDTIELFSPKGLTLWRNEKFTSPVTIEYDACVMMERPGDRLSDLNCFWMASDPHVKDGNIKTRMNERKGVFTNCYTLQLYYMGYGGNYNSTTRFRRYDGNEAGVTDTSARPEILVEYTDSTHLLRPNHWYHIRLVNDGNNVRYYIDGELLVDYTDPTPLKEGYFGFRTTLSRTRISNFRAK